jgi:predicted Zn-dependent peptidase
VRFAAEPQILIGFHKPTCPHPDDTVFDVIQALLSDGRTSRFYRSLVEGQEMAIEAWASNGWPGNRFDNLFVIGASPRYPHPVAELEKAIDRELERLKTEPVSPEELTRISNQVEASFIWGLGSNEGLALQLSHAQIVLGNWQVLVDYPGKIRQVTPADIRRVCRTYLTVENRCTAVLERAAEPKEGGGDAATPP